MASITKNEHKSYGMGLHDEVLTGRTQQTFFNPEEGENFFYNDAFDVDFNKRTSIDVEKLSTILTSFFQNCPVPLALETKDASEMKTLYAPTALASFLITFSFPISILNLSSRTGS